MKKLYNSPILNVVKIEASGLLATSTKTLIISDEENFKVSGDYALSNKYQSGLIWEDDNNEAE